MEFSAKQRAARRFSGTAILLYLTAAFLGLASSASGQEVSPPPIASSHPDASSYARDFDVSLSEAERRLGNEPVIDDLFSNAETVLGDTFGGVWVDHTEYSIVVAGTDGRLLTEVVVPQELGGDAELVVVEETFRELVEASDEVARLLAEERPSLSNAIAHDVLVSTREVEIFIGIVDDSSADLAYVNPTGSSAADLAERLELPIEFVNMLGELPGNLTVRLTREAAASEIRGGHALFPECTAGFNVEKSGGTKRITTAGHCDNALSFNGVNLPYAVGWNADNLDVQYHKRNGVAVPPRVKDATPGGTTPHYRTITGQTNRANMYGDYVCKYGATSGFTCGTVISTVFDKGPNHNATFVRVDAPLGVDLSQGGDSGAPWYGNTTAYGIHTGAPDTGANADDAYFMSVEYLPNGFYVRTG